MVKVADYLAGGIGGLEARILGSLPVAQDVNTPRTIQGEAMRYLAELPWNPDALLYNHTLDWTVEGPHRLRVATGAAASRAEVTLELDDNGLVVGAGSEARPRLEGRSYVDRPWHGHFRDYAQVDGRMIPMSGEVAWTIREKDFVYWRGHVVKWSAVAPAAVRHYNVGTHFTPFSTITSPKISASEPGRENQISDVMRRCAPLVFVEERPL